MGSFLHKFAGFAVAIVALQGVVTGCSSEGGDDATNFSDLSWEYIGPLLDVQYGDSAGATDNGTVVTDNGTVVTDNGTVVTDNGTVVTDNGTTVKDNGTVVTDNGTVVTDNGTVVPDDGPVDEGPYDPGPPCEYPTSDNGFVDNCDGTLSDPRYSKMWMKGHGYATSLDLARSHCADLNLGDHTDWRLPSVDEMRQLIFGCPNTATGGACTVNEHCPNAEACVNDACTGCDMNSGPGEKGCYADNFMEYYTIFLTDTQIQAEYTGDKRCYYVTFYNAAIDYFRSNTMDGAVKCIRP